MHNRIVLKLFMLFLFSIHCAAESYLLKSLFLTNSSPTKEALFDHLDKNVGAFIGDIKRLSRTNEKKLLFLNLKASLGHPKKRKNILFRNSSSGKLPKDSIPAHPWRKIKFKDTLKTAIVAWIKDEQFAQYHPDIAHLFIKLFGEYGAKRTGDNLEQSAWALFPTRSLMEFKYYPWPVILDPQRVERLEMLYVTKGAQVKNAFGHAALLMIMKPSSGDSDDNEQEQLDNQYVITFRAKVPDNEALQPRKAVTGHYPSLMYFEPLSDFLSGYMFKEERAVLRLPLGLSREQISSFVANIARRQLDYSLYRFFSNNCATEMLTLFQAFVPEPEIFTNPLSPDALIQLLVKCDIIDKNLWSERDLSFRELIIREDDGLAFVPPLKMKKFFIGKMKEKIESFGIEFENEEIFERIFFGAEKNRLDFYQVILSQLLQQKKDIDVLVKTMLVIEQQIKKEILFELIEQASSSDDAALLNSEQEIEEITKVVTKMVADRGSNLFPITTEQDLYTWYEDERGVLEKLQQNCDLKLSLPVPANLRLKEQKAINGFLSGLISNPVDSWRQ